MQAFVTAGAGFLLAVLWFDLMHDVLARGETAERDLDTIRRYYARVTRGAAPMNRLVAVAMLATLAAVVAELAGDSVPRWAAWPSLALVAAPVALAGRATVPTAVRLGQGEGGVDQARAVLRQHVFCFACISAVVVLQLASLAAD
jgi:hypothetical protein